MTKKPTVSVIITNYNYANYVAAAIESALNQTCPADEIIVIDDGSTDNSAEVIRSYQDRIRAIFQVNEGGRATKNTAFSHCHGELVIYLDADDLLYATAVEGVRNAFSPGVAKVQYDLDIIDANGARLGRRFCNFSGNPRPVDIQNCFQRTGTYLWPVTSGNAYARDFLRRVLPVTLQVPHDGVLNTIAPLYGRIVTIAEPQGQYRVHSRNNSRADDAGQINIVPDFRARIRIRKLEFDILREHAARLNCPLPAVDFLDYERVFTNYRIMARKMQREDGADAEKPLVALLLKGVWAAWNAPTTRPVALKHIVWLCWLALTPRILAAALIRFRFERAGWRSRLKQRILGGGLA
jgi:glycosyltransferase involved in cell wall biosynthesis